MVGGLNSPRVGRSSNLFVPRKFDARLIEPRMGAGAASDAVITVKRTSPRRLAAPCRVRARVRQTRGQGFSHGLIVLCRHRSTVPWSAASVPGNARNTGRRTAGATSLGPPPVPAFRPPAPRRNSQAPEPAPGTSSRPAIAHDPTACLPPLPEPVPHCSHDYVFNASGVQCVSRPVSYPAFPTCRPIRTFRRKDNHRSARSAS